MKKTPFYQKHIDFGAKMVDFAGFQMPIQYSGIKKEHEAVRNAVGLFDVSHMGEVLVEGSGAEAFLQTLTINDLSKLKDGKAQYSAMCYENGTMVDDLLVYRLHKSRFLLVINASNIEKDLTWIRLHAPNDVLIKDISESTCLLALQGPKAMALLNSILTSDSNKLAYYHFENMEFAGLGEVMVSATGYTGEKGFELYFDSEEINPGIVWDTLIERGNEFGLELCGLGARDTLRLEMGYALYGNDISDKTSPLEAGLGWITKLNKERFVGKEALIKQKEKGFEKQLQGFICNEKKAIPRPGYLIEDESGTQIGEVTSGGQSISLGYGIGMGYVGTSFSMEEKAFLRIRNNRFEIQFTRPPFLKK